MQHDLINASIRLVKDLFADGNWSVDLQADAIQIYSQNPISSEQHNALEQAVNSMISWRQGPYRLFDYELNSEWLSNIKWERLKAILPDLSDKTVADVGCSNGYFMFKLLTLNPQLVCGFDPFKNCHYQHQLLSHFIRDNRLRYITEGVEDLPHFPEAFDLILMMGVLYHRREPVQSINNLYRALKPDGCVLLETMVLPGDQIEPILIPDRYSKMKNIYHLTSIPGLVRWTQQAGFTKHRLLSVSQTSLDEQRVSPLAPYESLAEFLDPVNSDLTIEGWPAPRRILIELRK